MWEWEIVNIEVLPNNDIAVHERMFNEFMKKQRGTLLTVGQDVTDQPQAVQDKCAEVWTQEVIDNYQPDETP